MLNPFRILANIGLLRDMPKDGVQLGSKEPASSLVMERIFTRTCVRLMRWWKGSVLVSSRREKTTGRIICKVEFPRESKNSWVQY